MCLGIPVLVVETGQKTAKVDIGGTLREISIALCPDVSVGEYVLIHSGFAIQKLDEVEAKETLDLLRQITEAT